MITFVIFQLSSDNSIIKDLTNLRAKIFFCIYIESVKKRSFKIQILMAFNSVSGHFSY